MKVVLSVHFQHHNFRAADYVVALISLLYLKQAHEFLEFHQKQK